MKLHVVGKKRAKTVITGEGGKDIGDREKWFLGEKKTDGKVEVWVSK